MKTRLPLSVPFLLPLVLAGCALSPASQDQWVLSEVDGKPFPARVTLSLAEPGAISGMAPCNAYRAPVRGPAPRFDVGTVISTRAICPDGLAEQEYFFLLSRMERSEVGSRTLTLSNAAGQRMVFKAGG